jgi:hypothetical protein
VSWSNVLLLQDLISQSELYFTSSPRNANQVPRGGLIEKGDKGLKLKMEKKPTSAE